MEALMNTVKILGGDYRWLEDMSKRTNLEIYELLEIIIDFWRTEKGDSSLNF